MIVLDSSALMAILFDEPEGLRCEAVIEAEDKLLISAGTLAEALIVSQGRGVREAMALLIRQTGCEVVPVTAASANETADAYASWGKGFHSARLNYGDCFAYQLAQERQCPLLFVGNDFAQTDVQSALPAL